MSEIETGGTAFPQVEEQSAIAGANYTNHVYSSGGMTLRDYFAAKAMQANITTMADESIESDYPPLMTWHNEVARLSYMTADAMLRARNAKE